jgi:hypothetical protein
VEREDKEVPIYTNPKHEWKHLGFTCLLC